MKSLLPSVLVLLAACGPTPPPASTTIPKPTSAEPATAAPGARAWALPATAGAQPDLVALPDGTLLMSWVERAARGHHALRLARLSHEGAWSPVRTVAEGRDWFVNWADTPHVQATPDGTLWAHWLRKSAAATYAYDVVLSRSADGGATWSAPIRVNDDGTPTEHGFVAMWPASHDRLGIAWLDGRRTGGGHGHGEHGGGMMTLRSARFDARLARFDEAEVDASTCDCCQTDVAATSRGPLLVYRDRTQGEIRDIAATRLEGARWTPAAFVHADQWTMPACPVNGPGVAARGDEAVVAWYTGAGSAPSVRVARSTDAGTTFAPALRLDGGAEVLGRVDVALDAGRAWIAWLREDARGQSLWLARLSPDATRVEHRMEIARLQGRGRGTGLPRLARAGGRLHLVWTDVIDGTPRLQGATVALR
ncbi:sialidase family protein [Lysobacter humi (ex Lee et al. 2017)]